MKAIVYHSYGSPDVLKYEDVEKPTSRDDQVLIKVCAASVNLAQGVPLLQIRERLIVGNAPQKGSSTPRHIQWARSSIQGILESASEYAYGYKEQSRDGETYQIPVEPIIDIPTYELFKIQREKNKTNSPQPIRHDYLLSGHLKCACNLTWPARTATDRRSGKGEWIERKTPIGTYFCPQPHKELRASDCPKTISAKQAESQVWEKVSQFITYKRKSES